MVTMFCDDEYVLAHYTRGFYIARVARVAKLTWPFIVRIRRTHVRYLYSFPSLETAAKNWLQPAGMIHEYSEYACAFSKLFRTR